MYTYVHPFSLHDALPISRYRGDAAQRPGRSRRRDRDDVAGFQRGERGPALAAHGHRRVAARQIAGLAAGRSEEHTSELQSLMRISYAVFCLKKKKLHIHTTTLCTATNTTTSSPSILPSPSHT